MTWQTDSKSDAYDKRRSVSLLFGAGATLSPSSLSESGDVPPGQIVIHYQS
jgi:hypothetical protein